MRAAVACTLLLAACQTDEPVAPDAGTTIDAGATVYYDCNSQPNLGTRWVRCASPGAVPRAIAVDADGGIVIAGIGRGTLGFGAVSVDVPGLQTGFVVRYDADGTAQWARVVGGAATFEVEAQLQLIDHLAIAPDGDVVIGGQYVEAIDLGGTCQLPAAIGPTRVDVFVARLDREGTCRWARRIGLDDEPETVHGLGVDLAGDVYVLVAGRSFAGQTAGVLTRFVGKYDIDGDEQWMVEQRASEFERLIVAPGGGFAVLGTGDPTVDTYDPNAGAFVAQYSAAGEGPVITRSADLRARRAIYLADRLRTLGDCLADVCHPRLPGYQVTDIALDGDVLDAVSLRETDHQVATSVDMTIGATTVVRLSTDRPQSFTGLIRDLTAIKLYADDGSLVSDKRFYGPSQMHAMHPDGDIVLVAVPSGWHDFEAEGFAIASRPAMLLWKISPHP